MGCTGNLPPGVFAASFVASPLSQDTDPDRYIEYDLSTTETMELTITVESAPETPLTYSDAASKRIPVPSDQNVRGSLSVTAGLYDIYLQQTKPVTGPHVEVWKNLVVPAVTSEGGWAPSRMAG
jgi:hypothetical protein